MVTCYLWWLQVACVGCDLYNFSNYGQALLNVAKREVIALFCTATACTSVGTPVSGLTKANGSPVWRLASLAIN